MNKKEELETKIEEIKKDVEAASMRRKQEVLRRKVTSPFRILPTFLIIGVSKGGTTSLFRYLTQHPDIDPPLIKEINYFNSINRHFGEYLFLYWYKSFFPTVFERYRHRRKYKRELITGEATTHYIFNGNRRIPAMVRKLMPSVKLIVLLRNPIDRAYAHYHMLVRGRRGTPGL